MDTAFPVCYSYRIHIEFIFEWPHTWPQSKDLNVTYESLSEHILLQNSIKLEANYKNVTSKKEPYVWKFKNTAGLLIDQNRNHNGKFKISGVEWWGENCISKLWNVAKAIL